VMDISRAFSGTKVTYGIDHDAEFRGADIRENGLFGTSFQVQSHAFELSLPGRHNLENLLAAIATARTAGISWEGIARGVRELKPAYHRGVIVPWRGATIYDDTYNSNPYALTKAFALMEQVDVPGRRIAVVGDMLELGEKELEFHREAGLDVPDGIDVLIGVGPRSKKFLEGARDGGFDPADLHHFADAAAAGEFLKEFIREGDLVLIKASRGIGLDKIVTTLQSADSQPPTANREVAH